MLQKGKVMNKEIFYNKEYFTIKEYKKGTIIFNEGDICNNVFYILSGSVIIKTITASNSEEVITILNEDDFFGDILVFTSNPLYLGFAEAKTKAVIAVSKKDKFLNLLQNNREFLTEYLMRITNKSIAFKLQAKLFAHKKIEDRILYYFKHIEKNNTCKIESITRLSETLSLPRPSVSRSLQDLIKNGQISKIDRCTYIINKKDIL